MRQHTPPTLSLSKPLHVALTLLAVAALILAACGGDEAPLTPSATPTATPAATSTPTGTALSADTIDFTDPAVVGPLIDHFGGGEVPVERIEYLDFTGDGVDEALVVVESGGTQGDLGAAVLRVVDGSPEVMGYIDAGGRIGTRLTEAQGGVIASVEGVYEAGDPECCPSRLHERVYQWDGEQFALTIDQIIANEEY